MDGVVLFADNKIFSGENESQLFNLFLQKKVLVTNDNLWKGRANGIETYKWRKSMIARNKNALTNNTLYFPKTSIGFLSQMGK